MWGLTLPGSRKSALLNVRSNTSEYFFHPHYRSERPLDATLLKVRPQLDRFPGEQLAERIEAILGEWSAGLLRSPLETQAIARTLSADFSGASPLPIASRTVRSSAALRVRENKFANDASLGRDAFVQALKSGLGDFSKIETAESQIVTIDGFDGSVAQQPASSVKTRIRYEIVGTGDGFHREQRVGYWLIFWKTSESGEFRVSSWRVIHETLSRSTAPIYVDITAGTLSGNSSYSAQLLHGTDYWRTVLDGACGIDIYGHNGVSVADIDNDGFDDLYVCQPAGLPNRLYRNRGDGTFEDITEASGLGILENTACALFADFDNDGRQDVVLVRTNGPLLFLNEGNGKFRLKSEAFWNISRSFRSR